MIRIKYFYVDAGTHPKLGKVFHWQQRAICGEFKERYNQYLCEVLSSVAQSVDDCDRILNYIHEVQIGNQTEIETGGNDVTLTLTQSGVQVDIEINEDWIGQAEGHFQLAEWEAALKGWRLFLEMPKSLDSFVEVDLP